MREWLPNRTHRGDKLTVQDQNDPGPRRPPHRRGYRSLGQLTHGGSSFWTPSRFPHDPEIQTLAAPAAACLVCPKHRHPLVSPSDSTPSGFCAVSLRNSVGCRTVESSAQRLRPGGESSSTFALSLSPTARPRFYKSHSSDEGGRSI